jgi:hypothetical protein
MDQAVSRRPLTAESRVRARVNPGGVCGEQSGAGTGFSPSSSDFPCQYHPTVLHTHIIWGINNMSVVAAVQRRRLAVVENSSQYCSLVAPCTIPG